MREKKKIHGHLKMIEIDQTTGNEKVIYDEDNVITINGMQKFFDRIKPTVGGSYIHYIVLGTDVGSGTSSIPEPSDETLGQGDQDVLYTIPNADIDFTYPATEKAELVLTTTLDGTFIMDTYFPTESEIEFTSATSRLEDDTVFSYKRFSKRILGRLISVRIVWTFTFENISEELAEPQFKLPPCEGEDIIESGVTSLFHFEGDELSTDIVDSSLNNHTVDTFGDAALRQAKYVFGNRSLNIGDTNDYIRVNAPLLPASTDFALQCRVYLDVIDTNDFGIFTQQRSAPPEGTLYLYITVQKRIAMTIVSALGNFTIQSSQNVFALDGWRAIALTREGDTFRIFYNGNIVAIGDSSLAIAQPTESYIGKQPFSNTLGVYYGYIDEFRTFAGDAIYTASYSVENAPFPNP